GEVNARLLLGEVSDLLGRYDRMSQEMKNALALARATGFQEAESVAGLALAFARFRAGAQPGTFISANSAPIPDDPQQEAPHWLSEPEWQKIRTLFDVLVEGRRDEKVLQQLVAQSQGSQDQPLKALSLAARASLYSQQGLHEKAVPLWQQASTALQNFGQRDLAALAQFAHGASLWKLGDRDLGIKICKEAVENIENHIVSDIQRTDLLTAFLGGDHIQVYALLVEMLSQSGQAEDAFYYAEKARARAFLRMLGDQRFRIPSDADPELAARVEVLRSRIRRLELEAGRYEELQGARRTYQNLIIQLKQSSPDYAHLIDVRPLNADEVRRQFLPPDTSLVSFFVGSQMTLAWILDEQTLVQAVLPPSAADKDTILGISDLFAKCPNQSRGVERISGCKDNQDASSALYDKLIAPLRPYLRNPNLVIVPHGVLHYLPFAALRDPDSGRYLIEDFVLSYAPSASVLPYLRPDPSPATKALVAGNPVTSQGALPAAEKEACAVANLFGVQALTGSEATESAIRSSAAQERTGLLHLAAHGIYDSQNPRSSRIVLAPDGHHDGNWEVREIFEDLKLRGNRLVVLSGCQTGVGQRTGGDEVIGLTRAFLSAGSPAVISTLWLIDDQASELLMRDFYLALQAGSSSAQALRSAQLAMLQREEYQRPYYWAGFILNGDPRSRWSP
ncbi:MAG: CHAT domain-containing protein, partial [Acidobacteriota bacterium]